MQVREFTFARLKSHLLSRRLPVFFTPRPYISLVPKRPPNTHVRGESQPEQTSFLQQRSSKAKQPEQYSIFHRGIALEALATSPPRATRPQSLACLTVSSQAGGPKLLFYELLARNRLSTLIPQTAGVNARALVPGAGEVLSTAAACQPLGSKAPQNHG